MRLRQLKYPIAVLDENCLMGGINAGLASVRKWRNNYPGYYEKGGHENSIFFDSSGSEYKVLNIFFSRPTVWDRMIGIVTVAWDSGPSVRVDMELEKVAEHSLDEFKAKLRTIALENPSWWKRHSSKKEIEELFEGCETFAEAIHDLGVLDAPGKENLRGTNDKIVDLR